MTARAIREWRRRLALRQVDAADFLGVTDRMLRNYERNRWPVPRKIALACKAVEAAMSDKMA